MPTDPDELVITITARPTMLRRDHLQLTATTPDGGRDAHDILATTNINLAVSRHDRERLIGAFFKLVAHQVDALVKVRGIDEVHGEPH